MVRRLALQLVSKLPASVELDDLMQAGMMGLLDAVRRYQQTPDAQFETYAVTRVRGAMLDELRSQDWLPRSVRSKAKSIEQAIHALEQRLMRPPSEAEIAGYLDMPLSDYYELLDDARGVQIVHYEDLVRNQSASSDVLDRASFDSTPPPARANPLHQLLSQGLRQALVEAIRHLPEREQLLLSLQFEQDLNQKEISAVLDVSEGRVSQIRSQAVARIRAALTHKGWDEAPQETEYQSLL